MSPEKIWFKVFKKLLDKNGSILDLEIRPKSTTSWSNIKFDLTPVEVSLKLFPFATSVNRLVKKEIIDRSQQHKYIHSLLMDIFSNQFDVFFVLPQP